MSIQIPTDKMQQFTNKFLTLVVKPTNRNEIDSLFISLIFQVIVFKQINLAF